MDSVCFGCMVGFHEECIEATPHEKIAGFYVCCCWQEGDVKPAAFQRALKNSADLKDQQSTGRKRAVVVIESEGRGLDGSICEWAQLRFAGGGVTPIIGCAGTILRETKDGDSLPAGESPRNVHHGPDKSTINNASGNLHVVCAHCHNRWHTLNDPHYGKNRPEAGKPFVPDGICLAHDPETQATPEELAFSDAYWQMSPVAKLGIPYPTERLGELTHDG